MSHPEINDNHRRALTNAMRLVMRRLDEFVHLLADETRSGQSETEPEQIREISERIVISRQMVQAFCARFGLILENRTDPLWTIQVGVARLWEMLEDCKSGPLRGYGAVPAETQPVLDEEIQSLIDVIESISSAARDEKL